MKTKFIQLNDLKNHPHPASKLFRVIELQTIHKNTKSIRFRNPSLDLGCGDGYLSSILFDAPFTYGLDNNEAQDIHVAIKKKRYKKVLIESAEKMSLPDQSCNFVFSNSVIEHIPNNAAVLREVSRVLKKGGIFVFTVPSDQFGDHLYVSSLLEKYGFKFFSSLYKRLRNRLLNHYHLYSHREWNKRLKRNGLKLTNFAYYIDKETGMLWDKLAWEVKIRSIFEKNVERQVFTKKRELIETTAQHDRAKKNHGGSIFLFSVKE